VVGSSEVNRRVLERREEVRDRFGLLLLLLVGAFVALGFGDRAAARVIAGLLQVAALIVAFLATGVRRQHGWLAAVAALGVLAAVLSGFAGDASRGIGSRASIVVVVAILVAVLDRVLRHRRVTIQTLFGAVCGYFLLGLMFGSIYSALDQLGPDAVFGEPVVSSVYSYFSFTTLTTVGFGDYTAQTDVARRIVAIEAVFGQVFLATTLARLVSLYKSPMEESQ